MKVSVEKLLPWNPFDLNIWGHGDVTIKGVKDSIERGLLDREPYALVVDRKDFYKYSLEYHLARIAWLVIYHWTDRIHIDVGVPGINERQWIVEDGNHRLAAAIYRQDGFIDADLSGSVELIKKYFDIDLHNS